MRWWIPSLLAVVVLVELAPDARGRSARSEVAPYQEVKPYSAREKALLRDLKQDQQLYRRGVEIFNNTVDHLIERAYLNEKHLVERKYRKNLEEASRSAQSRRLEAIKEYEAFVKRYPNDKVWTPDVLMRLAELYYEKAQVDFRYADKKYQKRLMEIERLSRLAKRQLPMPTKPVKDYDAALEYYREILTRFPNYKNRDMVIYVLGYVMRLAAQEVEASDDRKLRGLARYYHAKARQAFLGLVCSNRFNPLQTPKAPPAPAGYNIKLTEPANAPDVENPFEGFDPYTGCRPAVPLSKFEGEELKKRRFLLSQSWFLIGEEHFDADPAVEIDADEKEMISKQYARYRGPAREEVFRNRWNEMLNEKKLRKLRLHNYYAISAYTRVAKKFPDSKEFNSALYKRAWTYFKIDRYQKALEEFDDLLVRAKEKDLQENAVRYVALCAFYQRQSGNRFEWLKKHYREKGWIDGPNSKKYPHVKAAFHQLAEVYWEESQPPPDDPGAENYDGVMLQKALDIYRWILLKGGFKGDPKQGVADLDWRYYKGKAPIQVRVLQILGMLMVNVDKRIREKFSRRRLYDERKRAFDRFSLYRGNPYLAFAKKYDERWNTDKEVAEALMILRENSLMAMGRDFFNLGGQYYNAYAKGKKKLEQLQAEQKELEDAVSNRRGGWYRKRQRLRKVLGEVETLKDKLDGYEKAYQGYFAQSAKAFRVIIEHPQYKNTLTAYKARFFMGQALYYSGKYLEAARVFKAVQHSKISVRKAKEALSWRLTSFAEVVAKIKLPPDPDPKKHKKVDRKPLPPLLEEYHQLLREMIEADPKSKDVPAYKYLIAAHYYRHMQFPEARPLFREIYEKHCDSRQAFYAGQHLLTMLEIEQPDDYLDQLERLTAYVNKKKCGESVECSADDPYCDQYKAEVKKQRKILKEVGPKILEARAFEAYNKKQFKKAALYFTEIIKRYPDSERIALFLYNAAYSYEKIKRYRSAKRMYELIYTKYKKQATETKIKDPKTKEVINDGILDDVLEYLSQVAIKALDYESALKYYGILATDPKFAKHPGRVAWYFTYAQLLKYHGKFDEAVRYFRQKYVAEVKSQLPRWRRLAQTTKDPAKKKMYNRFVEDAKTFVPRAELEIGQIRERQEKWRLMIRAYERYVREIEREFDRKRNQIQGPQYWVDNVKEYAKARQMMQLLDKILEKRRELRAGGRTIRRLEDRIVDNFDRYKLPPRTQAATAAAAIIFDRVKDNLKQFKKVKLKYKRVRVRWRWSTRNALKNKNEVIQKSRDAVADAIKRLSEKVKEYTDRYLEKRNKYTDDVWYIAFQAHIGKIYELAADQVADPPWPKLAKRWVDTFKKQFEDPFEFVERIKGFVFGTPNIAMKANETWSDLAKKFYKAALEHAAKAGIANQWTDTVRRWLARIDPGSPYINPPKIEPLR